MVIQICRNCRVALMRRVILNATPVSRRSLSSATASSTTITTNAKSTPNSTSDLSFLLATPTWSVRSLLPPSSSTTTTTTTTTSLSAATKPPDTASSPPPETANEAAKTPRTTTTTPEGALGAGADGQGEQEAAPAITAQTLRHLLRLSALPSPRARDEEARMLSTLASQLHFVRAIQRVDTLGVAPLYAVRDETSLGRREQTVGVAELRDALDREDVVGHSRRPRRRRQQQQQQQQQSLYERSREVVETPESDVEHWDVLGAASETAGRYFVVRSGNALESSHDPNTQ